ncbi:MAG: cytochrome c oxidase assembly protein [Acidiferrobacterales bacterium]
MSREQEFEQSNKRTMRKLFFVAIAMFGFGYALIPLYDIFCEITGTGNSITKGTAEAAKLDKSRTIKIEFTSHTEASLPWEFRPLQRSIYVHPGQIVIVKYVAKNLSGESIVGQAVPSISPPRAKNHFIKIECFCFTQQELKAGEEKIMPVQFYVDAKVPEEVDTITLSYAFFRSKIAKTAQKNGGKPVTELGERVSGHKKDSDA